jgi:hypothetical protein
MLHCVALVRTEVSEGLSAAIIRVTRIGDLGMSAVTKSVFLRSVHRLLVMADIPSSKILVTLMMVALSFSETSVLTRATWHNIQKDGIFQINYAL